MKPKPMILAVALLGLLIFVVAIGVSFFIRLDSEPQNAWSETETRRALTLQLGEDSVAVLEGEETLFTFSLLAGQKPTLAADETALIVSFADPETETVATASFRAGDPNVSILVVRKGSTLPREVGKGWIRMHGGNVSIFGFDDLGPREILEPEWVASWTQDPIVKLKNEKLATTLRLVPIPKFAPDPQNARVVWTYPRVDTDCEKEDEVTAIRGTLLIGDVPFFKVSASNYGKKRSVASVISVPSEGDFAPEDQAEFDARLRVLIHGHSDSADPRYGNGGLGFANVATTIYNVSYTWNGNEQYDFTSEISANCPTAFTSSLLSTEGRGVVRFSNGSAGVVVPDARPLSALVSGAFETVDPGTLDVYHMRLDASRDPSVRPPVGPWLKSDEAQWTLSDFATRRLGDVEILNDGGEVEFVSALAAADRVRVRDFVELYWLPSGNLELKAKEFSESGFSLVFESERNLEIESGQKFERRVDENATFAWWDFTSSQPYEISFPGQPPMVAIDWGMWIAKD